MIPGVALLVLLPLLLSPLAYLFRRRATLASFLSTGVALVLAAGMLWLPADRPIQVRGWQIILSEPVTLLGREMALTPANRLGLAYLFLVIAGLFLFAWRVSQGWTVFPLGLVLLSVLSGVLIIRPFIFSFLFLEVAVTLTVFLIQGGQTGSTRGALRLLVLTTLALPTFLIAGWLVDLYRFTPDNVSLVQRASLLITVGFAILLGIPPFHTWIVTVADEAPPAVAASMLSGYHGILLFLLLDLLQRFEWLTAQPYLTVLWTVGGLFLVGIGGGMALIQRRLGKLMGYAVLVDIGGMLLALEIAGPAGLTTALLLLGNRAVSLGAMGMGLSLIRHRAEGDTYEQIQGWGRAIPWATLALGVGGFSLAGFPPFAGFVGRWALLRLLMPEHRSWALLLILAQLGIALGLVRGLTALLTRPPERSLSPLSAAERSPEEVEAEPSRSQREPFLVVLFLVAGVLLCLGLGLWPQSHIEAIRRAVEAFTFHPSP